MIDPFWAIALTVVANFLISWRTSRKITNVTDKQEVNTKVIKEIHTATDGNMSDIKKELKDLREENKKEVAELKNEIKNLKLDRAEVHAKTEREKFTASERKRESPKEGAL